jgi:7-carboxy-7-deazaguanine synthase
MEVYEVVEHFISINGEGYRAGQLALFIRMKGCNLHCAYCDTAWANEPDAEAVVMSAEEIETLVRTSGVMNVTLTGGEPLLRGGMAELLERLAAIPGISIEIETNGSVNLAPYAEISDNISFTMDYKLACSGMEKKMYLPNFKLLKEKDTVKFVIGSQADLLRAKEILEKYDLPGRVHVYFSPVFGAIDPKDMVAFMTEHRLNQVNLQLQLHKFIWDPNEKGV